MKDRLIALRAEYQRELVAIEQRRAFLLGRTSFIDELLAGADEDVTTTANAAIPSERPEMPSPRHEKNAPKGTRISPRWGCVMAEAIRRYPAPVKYEEIPDIQRAANQEPASREHIRAHAWTFAKDGVYEKQGSGAFAATELAARALGMTLGMTSQQETEAPNGGELFGTQKTTALSR